MFELVRFARYALRFERAYRSDRWDDVARCFHSDAVYVIEGTATEYDGSYRGADTIVRLFQRMLDECDRKFDRRQPGFGGWPSVRGRERTLPWKVRYTLGDRAITLHGTSRCRFDRDRIQRLSDTMDADECARWTALARAS